MADIDKKIVITPATATGSQPTILFAGNINVPVTLRVADDNALSFENATGQLFSISNNVTSGTIFSVNDISGLPHLEIDANGNVVVGQNGGRVGVGTTVPTNAFHVVGNIQIANSATTGGILFPDGTFQNTFPDSNLKVNKTGDTLTGTLIFEVGGGGQPIRMNSSPGGANKAIAGYANGIPSWNMYVGAGSADNFILHRHDNITGNLIATSIAILRETGEIGLGGAQQTGTALCVRSNADVVDGRGITIQHQDNSTDSSMDIRFAGVNGTNRARIRGQKEGAANNGRLVISTWVGASNESDVVSFGSNNMSTFNGNVIINSLLPNSGIIFSDGTYQKTAAPASPVGPTGSILFYNGNIVTTTGTMTYTNNNLRIGDSSSGHSLNYNSTEGTLSVLGSNAEVVLQGINTEPNSPNAGNLIIYSKDIAGRILPKWKGPSGFDTPFQAILAMNKVAIWNAPHNLATVPGIFGFPTLTAVGTATARAVAVTNVLTRLGRIGYVSLGTAGSLCSLRLPSARYTTGDGAGLGGFFTVIRFGISDPALVTAGRMFMGMSSSTAAATNVSPATLTNVMGVGHNVSEGNLSLYYGGSAAQTPIALGGGFPVSITTAYELALFCAPTVNNSVGYRVTNLGTGNTFSGAFSGTAGTALPANTTLLGLQLWRTNAGATGNVAMDISSIYIETDF